MAAVGSVQDIFNRLVKNLVNWFGTDTPVLDALLIGLATTESFIYNLIGEANNQTRIKTATGENLDLISNDFFGNTLPRHDGENDSSFRNRILANLIQLKATRPAMQSALLALTGNEPILFEPWRPADCGGYNISNRMGYSIAGMYGSGSYAYQAFVDVFLPQFQGMGTYGGYNSVVVGYSAFGGFARGWYGGQSLIDILVSDQDVYDIINSTKVFGTLIWVNIHDGPEPPVAGLIYDSNGNIIYDGNGEPLLEGV